jgi:hypothetical protein
MVCLQQSGLDRPLPFLYLQASEPTRAGRGAASSVVLRQRQLASLHKAVRGRTADQRRQEGCGQHRRGQWHLEWGAERYSGVKGTCACAHVAADTRAYSDTSKCTFAAALPVSSTGIRSLGLAHVMRSLALTVTIHTISESAVRGVCAAVNSITC